MKATMKTMIASVALVFSSAAMAECYSIYTSSNELVWQSMQPPVPMNTLSIDREVQKMVPKGHLVVTNDMTAQCPSVDLTKPRKTMRDKAEEMKYD